MRIYTKLSYSWDGSKYVLDKSYYFDYNGPIALMCGASSEQKNIEQQQSSVFNQLINQSQQVFGGASQVFNALKNTFMPTIQAGPNQQGFSPAELSAMNAQIIQGAGQAYRNVKGAVGSQEAAVGGGNLALPSGVNLGTDLGLAQHYADITSQGLNQVTQENYAVGRQNYENAVKGLAGATDVFNPAATAANAATSSGEAAANTANQISQQNNSWMSAVSGALGGVLGTVSGGLVNKFLPGSSSAGRNAVPTSNG